MRRSAARFRLAALLSTASFALAGCGDATAPVPAEGAPDAFAFTVSGAETGTSTTARLDGGAVVVTHSRWTYEQGLRTRHVRAVPSAADWEAFWAAAEQAGVQRWQREYKAEHIVDGIAWSLELAGGGVAVHSLGINAYPNPQGDEQEGQPTPNFIAFLQALDTLTGWNFRK